jgi:hypothetical protein
VKWSSQNKPPGLSTLYTSNSANSSITPAGTVALPPGAEGGGTEGGLAPPTSC